MKNDILYVRWNNQVFVMEIVYELFSLILEFFVSPGYRDYYIYQYTLLHLLLEATFCASYLICVGWLVLSYAEDVVTTIR